MSGTSQNRGKKNGKKNKFLNIPEVLEVKSVKLETNKGIVNKDGKVIAKSEDNLRKFRKSNLVTNKNETDDANELDNCITKKLKSLSLTEQGEFSLPEDTTDFTKIGDKTDHSQLPLVMEYCPEPCEEQLATCAYKYYGKTSKSIKFTNQVTVLYFNGEDIVCESMEPLKKELDQQLRNKEMRKEHLLTKGPMDNVYLF